MNALFQFFSTKEPEPVRSSTSAVSAALRGACLSGSLVIASLVGGPEVLAQSANEVGNKPVVLVPPFENQSKSHHRISYEAGAGNKEGQPKRAYMVDRFTEAPRSILEDMLGKIDGLAVVERQRVDSLLVETEFGAMSGLVDQEKTVKLGKLLGANVIVMGTIIDIRDDTREFNGYGVKSKSRDVVCQLRVRLLDIETGTVRFSKIVKGTKTYSESSYGKTDSGDRDRDNSDRHFAAVESALEKLNDDAKFKAALFGKKPDTVGPATADGMVEVEFAPKPENCDIEIDGKYVGGSPLKRLLPAGKEVKVRIAKGGYKEWETVVVPEKGLRITRQLGATP
jgi:curli biogenesis system outer membrane secretion channel CsgG